MFPQQYFLLFSLSKILDLLVDISRTGHFTSYFVSTVYLFSSVLSSSNQPHNPSKPYLTNSCSCDRLWYVDKQNDQKQFSKIVECDADKFDRDKHVV